MLATQLWSAVSSPSMCFTFDMHDHCRSFNAASNNTRSWLLSNVIQQEFLFFSYIRFSLSYLSCDCYLSFDNFEDTSKFRRKKIFTSNLKGSRFIHFMFLTLREIKFFVERQFRSEDELLIQKIIESSHANIDEIYGK